MSSHQNSRSVHILLMTFLFTFSNASINFPGASFFSSGIFGGSKATDSPLAALTDAIPAASSPGVQYTTIDIGTSSTSNSQSQSQPGGSSTGQKSPPSHGSSSGSLASQQYNPASLPHSGHHSQQHQQSQQQLFQKQQQFQQQHQFQQQQPSQTHQQQFKQQQFSQQHQQQYSGSQFEGQQSPAIFGGPFPQKLTSQNQNNANSPNKGSKSNSPVLPYNPNLSLPAATYSSGGPPAYSGNSQPHVAPQTPNIQFNQLPPPEFVTNAYDAVKLKDDGKYRPQETIQFGSDGFLNKGKNTPKKGAFSWTSPEGQLYEVTYVADALNSRPHGNFVGSPQQIPEVNPPSRLFNQEALKPYGNSLEQVSTFTGVSPPYPDLRQPNYNTYNPPTPVQSQPIPHSQPQPHPQGQHQPSQKPYTRFPIF